MAKGVVVRTDRCTDYEGVRSAKYYVDTTATAIENGHVVKLDSLMTNEREMYKAVTPAAGDELWIVTTPEVQYDEKKTIFEYENEAGKALRVERYTGRRIEISEDALTFATAKATDLVAGAVVVGTAATKLTIKAAGVAGDKVYGVVREKVTHDGHDFAYIEFATAVTTVPQAGV